MRGLFAACIIAWIGSLIPAAATTTAPAAAAFDSAAAPVAAVLDPSAPAPKFDLTVLDPAAENSSVSAVTDGSLDARFAPPAKAWSRAGGAPYWAKLVPRDGFTPAGIAVVVMQAARQTEAELFAVRAGEAVPLARTMRLPQFLGTEDTVFAVPGGLERGQALYARIDAGAGEFSSVGFRASTLDQVLAGGTERARMIALAFGALTAMALAALLIWFVLADPVFVLYATLFFLQALYIAYLSGQGFDWPWLSFARPLSSFAWNVPAGLSGAVACLFTREIAELRRFSPRIYTVFGWLAVAFVVITFANVVEFLGLGVWVNMLGNLVFIGAALFTLAVAFLAWRRGSRPAGWFLIAWGLLEGFTIAAAVRFLFSDSEDYVPLLYYYGLPLSMVAAAVLIALGVADRLRAQRLALTEAERRAQIDPLTGVLNRRSLIERLEAACLRARARGLPISLLFIDLDHFKQINDSFGHQAGDACLRAIIEPIHAELRQSDVIGRYGGEEFVVILSSADAAAANPIAQRILERVAGVRVDGFGASIRLTCSIGVAASDTLGVWGEHLIAQADAAVYRAKRLGRNQVQMAAPAAV